MLHLSGPFATETQKFVTAHPQFMNLCIKLGQKTERMPVWHFIQEGWESCRNPAGQEKVFKIKL